MLYFTIQNRLQAGTSKVSEAGYPRISSDYGRIVFLLAEALQGFSAQILTFKISCQAQYLVRLGGDFTGFTHWKWGFICDANHSWHSFCVAGAVFGEVGGWLDLLHALEMSFHMWRRSSMTFILRGRRSIWWGWKETLLAPRIGNELSYVTQIIDDIHFAWQAQYLVKLDGDFCCAAQHRVVASFCKTQIACLGASEFKCMSQKSETARRRVAPCLLQLFPFLLLIFLACNKCILLIVDYLSNCLEFKTK